MPSPSATLVDPAARRRRFSVALAMMHCRTPLSNGRMSSSRRTCVCRCRCWVAFFSLVAVVYVLVVTHAVSSFSDSRKARAIMHTPRDCCAFLHR